MNSNKLINWRKVSELLSGNPSSVRSDYSGNKYKAAIDELKTIIQDWIEKYKT